MRSRAGPRASAARAPELVSPATTFVTVVALGAPAVSAAAITDEGRSAAAIVGWALLIAALLFGVLPRARPGRRSRFAAAALACLVGWTALSMLWTETEAGTFVEIARVLALAAIPLAVWVGVGPRTWRSAGWGLVWVCLTLPALAVLSRLWPDLVSSMSPDLGAGLRRLSFPLGYWNALGAVSAAAAAAGLALSVGARGEWRRAVAGGLIPVAGLAVYLSYSRAAAALALLAGLGVVLAAPDRRRALLIALVAAGATAAAVIAARSIDEIALGSGGAGGWVVALVLAAASALTARIAWAPRTGRPAAREARPPARLVVAAGLGALALAAAAVLVSGPVDDAATPPVSEAESTLRGDPAVRLVQIESHRYELWGSAFDAFRTSPVAGIGAGSFTPWWARSREPGDEPVADAHSLYLETLAELGVVGAALLAAALGGLVAAALEARRALSGRSSIALWTALLAIGAVVLAGAAVDWLWESGIAFALGVAALAIAAAPTARSIRAGRHLSVRRLALIGVATAGFAAQVPVLVGTSAEKDAADALRRGDLIAALAEVERALDAAPWAAEPYALRARALLAARDPGAAREAVAVAVAREPTEPRYRELLARVDARLDASAERQRSPMPPADGAGAPGDT